MAGAILAADRASIDQARIWQRRHGGNLVSLYPYVISAKLSLQDNLDKMGSYHRKAKSLAIGLNRVEGISTAPQVPQTNMMKIYLNGDAQVLIERAAQVSQESKTWLFGRVDAADIPGWNWIEISVSDATLELEDSDIVNLFSRLVEH